MLGFVIKYRKHSNVTIIAASVLVRVTTHELINHKRPYSALGVTLYSDELGVDGRFELPSLDIDCCCVASSAC